MQLTSQEPEINNQYRDREVLAAGMERSLSPATYGVTGGGDYMDQPYAGYDGSRADEASGSTCRKGSQAESFGSSGSSQDWSLNGNQGSATYVSMTTRLGIG